MNIQQQSKKLPGANGHRNSESESGDFIVGLDDPILITGASGFIGGRVVHTLANLGFRDLRCFVRPSSNTTSLEGISNDNDHRTVVKLIEGNLLSKEDCATITKNVAVIFHLAAGRGQKSFADAFLNSVITTRNLLEGSLRNGRLRRFVNISSFAVYTNRRKLRWRVLDEQCPIEKNPELIGSAYSFAKVKQDEIVADFGRKFGVPYVTVRPGYVYGPGNEPITGRVGIDSFGVFLHLGGSNAIPFTYVDNCADAIALAGLTKGVDGEVFNVVDDELPSSRKFLSLYKRNVKQFKSFYLPHFVSYLLCYSWEKYSAWSKGQLPPAFNRRRWHNNWKKTHYSNEKLKAKIGWTPKVPTTEGLRRYFQSCREREQHA